ncbi:MAG: 3-hydroxyacyl-CoA dehydrogenase, partial [Planctomycetes bacterium]|nr:3-hydroxyacyl-CoA dehydrogenase [Planctomycetota bacterium]
ERQAVLGRLVPIDGYGAMADCDLVIEAAPEDPDLKTSIFERLGRHTPAEAILATNTSSLAVAGVTAAAGRPARSLGMHFFNPAPIMKLVEVIQGAETDPAVVDRVAEIAVSWGKKVARAADVPGFIVNHVARPYYLEAFRILEDGYASPDVIDRAMKSLGGFRMGPLELTDFIGQDVNTATTRSVWEQLDRPALLTPSQLQETLVADGYLGRKTGRGVYDYGGDEPVVALRVDHRSLAMTAELREAASGFVRKATNEAGDELEEYIFARILVALITQAKLANERGVAEKADIDTALKFGVNYPKGPFEWADQIGPERVNALKRALG